jgi:hypothetical protein
LIDPIAIRQFVMPKSPADVCVFAFVSLEWNSEERGSYRGDEQNKTRNEENCLPDEWLRWQVDALSTSASAS